MSVDGQTGLGQCFEWHKHLGVTGVHDVKDILHLKLYKNHCFLSKVLLSLVSAKTYAFWQQSQMVLEGLLFTIIV